MEPEQGGAPTRVPRRPSQRNLAIYEAVKVRKQRQVDVAAEYGVSQRRISKICQQVEHWRDPAAREATPEALERHLVRQQLDEVYRRSLWRFERSGLPLIVERSGERGGQPWSERCVRERPVEVKWLKLALQAAARLAELEQSSATINTTKAQRNANKSVVNVVRLAAILEAAG